MVVEREKQRRKCIALTLSALIPDSAAVIRAGLLLCCAAQQSASSFTLDLFSLATLFPSSTDWLKESRKVMRQGKTSLTASYLPTRCSFRIFADLTAAV